MYAGIRRIMACVGCVGARRLHRSVVGRYSTAPSGRMIVMGLASFSMDLAVPPSWAVCHGCRRDKPAGTLSGGMNMMGNLAGSLGPLATGLSVGMDGHNWDVALYTFAASYFLGTFCWLFLDPVTPLIPSTRPGALMWSSFVAPTAIERVAWGGGEGPFHVTSGSFPGPQRVIMGSPLSRRRRIGGNADRSAPARAIPAGPYWKYFSQITLDAVRKGHHGQGNQLRLRQTHAADEPQPISVEDQTEQEGGARCSWSGSSAPRRPRVEGDAARPDADRGRVHDPR